MTKTMSLGLAVFVVFFIFSQFDNKNKTETEVLRVTVAKNIKNLDYIFVGPSYVYNGIIPAAFDSLGLNTFNLGQAAVGPGFSELLIEDYIKASGSLPKTIVLSMSYTTFSDVASDPWGQFPIHRNLNFPLSNEVVSYKYAGFKEYIKLLRNGFKKGLVNVISSKTELLESSKGKIFKLKGYSKSMEVYTPAQYASEKKLFLPYLRGDYSNKKEELFLKIVKQYKDQNIRVVVIEPPTFKLKDFFTNEFKHRYKELKGKCAALGIDIVETNISLDSTCFKNLDHLNYRGARFYTQYLISKVVKS